MVSSICALPFFIFVLSNSCFTLPIVDEQLPTSTYLPENDHFTTAETLNLRLVDDDQSSAQFDMHPRDSTEEHMGFEASTSIAGLREEIDLQPRSTEKFSTSERSFSDKRTQDDFLFTTMEPTLLTTEQASNEKRDYDDSSSSPSESMTFTTEESYSDKHENDDRSYTTDEATIELDQLNRRGFEDHIENSTQAELTTNDMLSLTSTSSAKSPELYTSKSSSSISTSTKKYIVLLKDNNEQSTKQTKNQRKSSRILQVSSPRKSQVEDKSTDEVPNIPNDLLMVDESNDLLITALPNRIFPLTTTLQKAEEEEAARPLNQGSTLLLFLLAALLFSACVLASTLAFVKTRHTLKKKESDH